MATSKTYEEINQKIRSGKAVVVTAEEILGVVEDVGVARAARDVDVVTTGTFGIMCSSGAFLNFGHTRPKMKMNQVWLNGVPAYGGIAAVDAYLGATEVREGDPLNTRHPGQFPYGGGHVLEDLVAGRPVQVRATGYGTDCYPRRSFERTFTIRELRDATMFNPRNCYQNYNVGTNLSKKTIYTYMGILRPDMGNIFYSGAGQLSPLLNDPYLSVTGLGTRIFLGGGTGYVAFPGTQHCPQEPRNEKGIPTGGAGTLALIGDMKTMDARWVRGVSLAGYGVSLMVGLGIPIPILDEGILAATTIRDQDIQAPLVDYGLAYPEGDPGVLGYVDFAELRSGSVEFRGRKIPASPLSSYSGAREIANLLKARIQEGSFELTRPAAPLPGARDWRS